MEILRWKEYEELNFVKKSLISLKQEDLKIENENIRGFNLIWKMLFWQVLN